LESTLLKRLALIVLLLSSLAAFAQTTTFSGTISDLTGTPVTSGQVLFDLKPGVDSTISGVARFTPQTVTCGIDGTGALKNQALSGACVVTNNTALTPSGTSYKVTLCPNFACTSSFVTYATGGTVSITTVAPTPATSPVYNLVDTLNNQTIGGNKNFTGTVTFSGTFPSLTATTINSGTFNSTAANAAASGLLNAPNNACIAAARNAGNSADVCTLKLNTSNQVVLGTSWIVPAVSDQAVGRATTDTLTNKTLTSPSITSPAITGNMTYASTTPVANLTASNHPTVFNAAGTQQTAQKVVTGAATLTAGTATVALSGSAAFAGTYVLSCTDNTAAAAVRCAAVNGSSFTITGTGTDVITWIAIGN
jgi:hypothetical protein